METQERLEDRFRLATGKWGGGKYEGGMSEEVLVGVSKRSRSVDKKRGRTKSDIHRNVGFRKRCGSWER